MTSESIGPDDTISYDDVEERQDRERDGVGVLHDAEAEAGDEEELDDDFDLDRDEARDLGADLDRLSGETPRLD